MVFRQFHTALTNLIEQRLHDMCEFDHIGQPKRRRPALDRMRCTKNRITLFFVRRRYVNCQQQSLHLSQ